MAPRNCSWISLLVSLSAIFSHIVELTHLLRSLRVAGSELGIRLGEERIHPPFVCLISTATTA